MDDQAVRLEGPVYHHEGNEYPVASMLLLNYPVDYCSLSFENFNFAWRMVVVTYFSWIFYSSLSEFYLTLHPCKHMANLVVVALRVASL